MSDLRTWAEQHAPKGHLQAHQVLKLLEKTTALEADLALARRTILELSERVAAQSELLSRKATREAFVVVP